MIITENKKCWKLPAFVHWLTVLEVSILFLCNTPSLVEGMSANLGTNENATPDFLEDVCLTPGCIHTASAVLKNMDPNVNPCEDFYQYACGGFIKETIIPDSESSVNNFAILEKKVRQQLKLRIQAQIEPNEPTHFKLVKNFYKTCMNKTAIEAAGLNPLRAQLDKLGGWPVILGDAWNEDEFVWTDAIYKLRDAGHSYTNLINFDVNVDLNNSTKRVIYIDQAELGIPESYLSKGLDDEIVDGYYKYMVDIAIKLGAPQHRALRQLKESLIFEMKLANISLPDEERRNTTRLNNPMTLAVLSDTYPSIPWKEYFSRLLPPSITIDNEEVVIVCVPSYFTNLQKLLSETPKRIQANYLLWRAIVPSISYLNDDVRRRREEAMSLFTGNTEPKERSEECVQAASDHFPIILGAMYVKQYFDKEAKKHATEMVMDIRQQLKVILQTVDWMDETTRKRALDKATGMVSHIGYPDELLDDKKLEKFYEKLEMPENHYFESMLNLSLFNAEYSLSQLRNPINKTEWISHGISAVVNAFYSPDENSIQFPAGILQGIFFNNDRPNYMNYGAIGYIIGHEITHGFDDEGSQFDKNGNLVNWWEPTTAEHYRQRVQCIIEQYGNYTVPEIDQNLNGVNTQGENVADNGGIKVAYLAYKSWVARNKAEKKLPGIDRTPQQMFWLSAANVWCSKIKREALRSGVISDPHSPEAFRVLGPFSNMPEFAIDFNCPAGSRMNPQNKCSIW